MDVIGDETRMIVGVPDPAGIIVFMGDPTIPGLGWVGSWKKIKEFKFLGTLNWPLTPLPTPYPCYPVAEGNGDPWTTK